MLKYMNKISATIFLVFFPVFVFGLIREADTAGIAGLIGITVSVTLAWIRVIIYVWEKGN